MSNCTSFKNEAKVVSPTETIFYRLVFEQSQMGLDKVTIVRSLEEMGLKNETAKRLIDTICQ